MIKKTSKHTDETVCASTVKHYLPMVTSLVDCHKDPESYAILQCSNNTLSITWYTNLQYYGDVRTLPEKQRNRLLDRLRKASLGFLKIFVINHNPPYVLHTET